MATMDIKIFIFNHFEAGVSPLTMQHFNVIEHGINHQ